jgi:hypothetical protein
MSESVETEIVLPKSVERVIPGSSTKPVVKAPAPKTLVVPEAPKTGKVTFFWKDNRNQEFSITTAPATKDAAKQIRCFGSVGSVLSLNEEDSVEAMAIAYLRGRKDYRIAFDEVESRNTSAKGAGARLDELMALDHKVLAQMVGGSVKDFRKTKGELIAELQSMK